MKFALIITFLAVSTPAATLAGRAPGDSSETISKISRCRDIADSNQRLECFDKAVDAFEEARAKKEIVVVDRATIEKTERSLFGFTVPKLNLFERDGKAEEQAEVEVREIESTITSVASGGYGKWVLGLADGSSWQTIEMNTALEPRKGQAIRIERAALGSFRASIGGKKLLRIKRVG